MFGDNDDDDDQPDLDVLLMEQCGGKIKTERLVGLDTESKIGAYLASQELSQFTDDEEDGDHRPSFADMAVPLATTDDEVSREPVTFPNAGGLIAQAEVIPLSQEEAAALFPDKTDTDSVTVIDETEEHMWCRGSTVVQVTDHLHLSSKVKTCLHR